MSKGKTNSIRNILFHIDNSSVKTDELGPNLAVMTAKLPNSNLAVIETSVVVVAKNATTIFCRKPKNLRKSIQSVQSVFLNSKIFISKTRKNPKHFSYF